LATNSVVEFGVAGICDFIGAGATGAWPYAFHSTQHKAGSIADPGSMRLGEAGAGGLHWARTGMP
jgi:hypothetical protein